MAYYKVSVDVSDLFDDMLVHAQKSFLIDKFCSLATDQQIEVVPIETRGIYRIPCSSLPE